MRLTKTMRETFVAAAMADVPEINYIEQIDKAAMDKSVALLPPKVRAVWQDKEIRHFVPMTHVRVIDGGFDDRRYIEVPGIWNVESTEREIQRVCADLAEKHLAQKATRRDLARNLSAIAMSCPTRKALAEALPEFEKYLPADDAAANRQMPVVTGVVTAFMKAGWPKGGKPAQRKNG